MKLHTLKAATTPGKRRGRGTASGSGKTAGRGTKGQKSRAGHHYMPRYFEGGQMPLAQRIPKLRGFRSVNSSEQTTVSTSQLAKLSGTKADTDALKAAGLVPRRARRVTIVAGDKPGKKLSVSVDKVTAGAAKLIKASGGTVTETRPKQDGKA